MGQAFKAHPGSPRARPSRPAQGHLGQNTACPGTQKGQTFKGPPSSSRARPLWPAQTRQGPGLQGPPKNNQAQALNGPPTNHRGQALKARPVKRGREGVGGGGRRGVVYPKLALQVLWVSSPRSKARTIRWAIWPIPFFRLALIPSIHPFFLHIKCKR